MSTLAIAAFILSSECNAQFGGNWVQKASGGRLSTPKQIQRIAPRGLSYTPVKDEFTPSILPPGPSRSNTRTNNPYNVTLGSKPAKTKSYAPKVLATGSQVDRMLQAKRDSVQQSNQGTQALANALGDLGQMIQQNQARQQYQQPQTYRQPAQQYQQYQQQHRQPTQPVQQYRRPMQVQQRQYHNVQQPVRTYFFGN